MRKLFYILIMVCAANLVQAQEKTGADTSECSLKVPAVIGVNDMGAVSVECTCRLIKIDITIFNRWGNLLYEEHTDFQLPFPKEHFMDWKYQELNAGTFFYTIKYMSILSTGNTFTGENAGSIIKL